MLDNGLNIAKEEKESEFSLDLNMKRHESQNSVATTMFGGQETKVDLKEDLQ